MNKTITKLWEEAAQRDDLWEQARYERFAELVVKECMSNLYLHGYDDAVSQLKQHFGVEE